MYPAMTLGLQERNVVAMLKSVDMTLWAKGQERMLKRHY